MGLVLKSRRQTCAVRLDRDRRAAYLRGVTSRRQFLETSALFAATAALERAPVRVESLAPRGFIDLRRAPDSVMVQTGDGDRRLVR
jgi:hypothetical protein